MAAVLANPNISLGGSAVLAHGGRVTVSISQSTESII